MLYQWENRDTRTCEKPLLLSQIEREQPAFLDYVRKGDQNNQQQTCWESQFDWGGIWDVALSIEEVIVESRDR